MDIFTILVIIGLAAGIVGISVFVRETISRKGKLQREPTEDSLRQIDTKLEQIAEYLDGLPSTPPKIKDTYIEAKKLEKEYKYREAIRLYEASFKPETTASQWANLHNLIGDCFSRLSELEEAEGHYRQAAAAASEANDDEELAKALGSTGLIYQTRGELDKALDYHQQALKIDREADLRKGEANDLGSIGLIYQRQGNLDKALDYHQQALKIDREIGYRDGEAAYMGNIGRIYHTRGELEKALEYLHHSI